MGLAASQARFLGITLRKANCEFKSTELAQQRLELTNQMTDISQEYSDALNSTKLVWHNEAVCDSFGNPMDYGLSYGLLMMPSAANDFTPYMVTTRSGAIVLNSKYAQAAKDAGISMSGGIPSAEGRKKFLKSLSQSSVINGVSQHDNIITEATYNILEPSSPDAKVAWHYTAGMGAVPKDKGVADITTLNDLKADGSIGKRGVDWLQIERGLRGLDVDNAMTSYQYNEIMQVYKDNVAKAKLNYMNKIPTVTSTDVTNMVLAAEAFATTVIGTPPSATTVKGYSNDCEKIIGRYAYLENQIKNASNTAQRNQYQKELENLRAGICSDISFTGTDDQRALCSLYWAVYDKQKAAAANTANSISWSPTGTVDIGTLLQTSGHGISGGTYTTTDSSGNNVFINKLTVVESDTINTNEAEIKGMTISDLLSRNIVLITKGNNAINSVSKSAGYIMDYIAEVFGLGHIGTGLNVDTESEEALRMALSMVKKKFLKEANAVRNGSKKSDNSMLENSAYLNATKFNRIGATDSGDYAAVSLSNMVSAFLTYFDNFLRGTESAYVVGKGNTDGKTIFVTDDMGYAYVTNKPDEVTDEEKIADFFNELYNNICEHGWRYDDMVQDNEYLESAVKDGRYSLMALNDDGYFYQERYNDVGYLEEVQDEDAIARAEAAFTAKKAEITFKEDTIDVKSKKLDAEITELNTEINSVQNIISKTIEKTFSLFSS